MTTKDSKVLHFTSETWKQDVLESDLPVLVDFTATWCGPCKQVAPLLTKAAKKREGTMKIGKLDIDENSDIAARYGVQGIPTLLVFVKGEVIGQSVGSLRESDLSEFLDHALDGQRPGLPKKRKG